jgi:flavin-dependent dehydrogenase
LEAAQYDLIVIGAGPAGSACAITAARHGVKVLLLEKDEFPRQKVCGEFVSSESLALLGGLLGENQFGSCPQIASSRIFLDGKVLTLPVSPAAQSIPRFDLDAALFQVAMRSGVKALERMAVREVQRNGTFNVIAEQNTFSARAIINATGRWSKLTQFDIGNKEKWIGLKAHFKEARPAQSVDLYFFAGGYCGVTPVTADSVNACAMVRSDVAHTLEEVFAKEPHLWQRSRTWQPMFSTVTTSPLYFREPQTELNGMLLAGDSAGFIDPFAGDGISLALQSGTLAAETIIPYLRGANSLEQAHRHYQAEYRKRFSPAFRNAARLRAAFAGIPSVGKMLVRGTRAR